MIYCGDNLDLLRSLADCSVDAIVTDPPYELGFMGRKWDRSGVAYDQERWRECLRVAKPGAHLLAFGGTRTYHRMATAIEDAGWEIRDCLQWLYGSGFPKSLDVGKALDKAAGAEREVVGKHPRPGGTAPRRAMGDGWQTNPDLTAPATPLAAQWDGWGTALKPACEPIVMARKPLDGTVAANVAKWGTGAINVDGGRIATGEADARAMERCNSPGAGRFKGNEWAGGSWPSQPPLDTRAGRWPANVLLDERAAEFLDQMSGERPSTMTGRLPPGAVVANPGQCAPGMFGVGGGVGNVYADTGGASRFFKVARWSQDELLLCRAKAIMAAWQPSIASSVESSSTPSREAVASAVSDAATLASQGSLRAEGLSVLSMPATASECAMLCESVIALILSFEPGSWPASLRTRLTPFSSPASCAAGRGSDTTTTTPSPLRFDGYAVDVTFVRTSLNTAPGGQGSPSRFAYVAKASRAEREAGLVGVRNDHCTVKPIDLLRYLCRLVCPPGGLILDPYTGSGTTGIACVLEGFAFVGAEQDPDHHRLAEARIAAAMAGAFTVLDGEVKPSGQDPAQGRLL